MSNADQTPPAADGRSRTIPADGCQGIDRPHAARFHAVVAAAARARRRVRPTSSSSCSTTSGSPTSAASARRSARRASTGWPRAALRFANYTTVPMCTPARAALLTGKNPHAVGCGWLTFNDPGYPGYRAGEIARDAPTLAELLRAHGYSTYAVGKWHNTAEHNVAPSGRSRVVAAAARLRPLLRLPRRRDALLRAGAADRGQRVPRPRRLRATATTAPTTGPTRRSAGSRRMRRRRRQAAVPLRRAQRAARAAAREARGPRALRGRVRRRLGRACAPRGFERQRAKACSRVAPRCRRAAPGVPAWDDVDATRRQLHARYMELYAAVVDNMDQNIGRLVDGLDALGRLDNTLVILTSDNGANGIGGIDGAVEQPVEAPDRCRGSGVGARHARERAARRRRESWPAYPLGWTDVSSTPFRLYKTTTMNGGIRVPLVAALARAASRRRRGAAAVGARHRHRADACSICSASPYPDEFNGYRTRGPDGASFRAALEDGRSAGIARNAQHYELAGNRGYIRDGWKIVSLQPPGKPIDLDNWMLFDLRQRSDRDRRSRQRAAGEARRAGGGLRRGGARRTTCIRSTTAACAGR